MEFALSASLKLSRADYAVPSAILANTTVNVVRSISVSTGTVHRAFDHDSFPVPRYKRSATLPADAGGCAAFVLVLYVRDHLEHESWNGAYHGSSVSWQSTHGAVHHEIWRKAYGKSFRSLHVVRLIRVHTFPD